MAEKVLGIDLGTTNTCFAVLDGGTATVISNSEGGRTTPSAVSFVSKEELVVGDPAIRRSAAHPEETVLSVKRLIGRRPEELEGEADGLLFEISRDEKRGAVSIIVQGREYAPEQISSYVIGKVKNDVKDYVGEEVTKAVITVPAYFNDAQRTATKQAAEIAGLEVLRLVNEPTAAALAYGFGQSREEQILVFDLGGGTFDVSVLDIGDGVFDVLATSGDNHLGGDDFDRAIAEFLIDQFKNEHGIDLSLDYSTLRRIYEASEKAKIELSSMNQTKVSIPFITAKDNQPLHMEIDISRAKFEEIVSHLIKRLEKPIQTAIEESGISLAELDHVILVGGMTRMPAIFDLVKKITGKDPQKNVNQDEAVAIGAAIQAGIILGQVEDLLLLDVIPLALGIETKGGVAAKLIPSNSTIPIRISEIFTTAEDNQPSVEINIIQGERGMASDNRSLGRVQLLGIPPSQAGLPQVEVTFDVDSDGILSVKARDLGTGKATETRIESSTGLSDSDIEKMKEDAKLNKESDQKTVRLQSEIVSSEIVASRVRDQLEFYRAKMTEKEKDQIEKYLLKLESSLSEEPDYEKISRSRRKLLEEVQVFSSRIYEESIIKDVLSESAAIDAPENQEK